MEGRMNTFWRSESQESEAKNVPNLRYTRSLERTEPNVC